jgi:hypothetical protein
MIIQGQKVIYIEPGPKHREAEIEAITETHVLVHVYEHLESGASKPIPAYTIPLTIPQLNEYVLAKEDA